MTKFNVNLINRAIEVANSSEVAYFKFITANDAGATGGHQSGYHIHKDAYALGFDVPGIKGKNKDRFVKIKWQDDLETESRFIYYGVGTRDEYRLTRFGPNFPFLSDDYIGSLLLITRLADEHFAAYVLNNDDDIEDFLAYFSISPQQTNGMLQKTEVSSRDSIALYKKYIDGFSQEFPSTLVLAEAARSIYDQQKGKVGQEILSSPDKILTGWIESEYELFKALENERYRNLISQPFSSVESLISTSNTVLNRRKSRAGKSLEHHLAKIFDANKLKYSAQEKTEGDRRPDFIMPSIDDYRNPSFENSKLVFLGAKTTCKDRWRQVINEAARIRNKHLFTLQQGVSSAQLNEMANENLTLVIPAQNFSFFPTEHRDKLVSLKDFIAFAKETNH